MTRLLFDATSLDSGPSGSKARLLRLIPELLARGHDVTTVMSARLEGLGKAVMTRRRGPIGRWLQPSALASVVAEVKPEVFVFETLPPPRLGVPMIGVVHDLRHVQAGGLRKKFAIAWLREAAQRVYRFHVVSRSTGAVLEAVVPEASGRIDVVPNAVLELAGAPPAPLPAGVAPPFVFAAGHSELRKQWPFVAAVATALAPHGIKMVRAGRGRERHRDVIDVGVVSDAVRDSLFRHSVAVFAPSRLEGFGLVPLEALACGAWVVASDIPAHREILGEAVDYIPVSDADLAVRALLGVAKASQAEREARAHSSLVRASMYPPLRSADAFEKSLAAAGL